MGVAIATRYKGTHELEGVDAEGGVFSPGLGHEAFAEVVLISGDKKTTVCVYEVGPSEGEVAFTRVTVEGYNLLSGSQYGFLG